MVWITALPSLASHRGGVLRVETPPIGCECIDPAFAGEAGSRARSPWPLAYDGLVAYRRVGGIAGLQLVGNLVSRLPALNDGGRTYTFQLRPGIRFSDGSPSARVGLPLQPGAPPDDQPRLFLPLQRHRRCVGVLCPAAGALHDLSKGIVVDDRRAGSPSDSRMSTRTSSTSWRFLSRPSSRPERRSASCAPSRFRPRGNITGSRASTRRGLRLVRNPHFRVWSRCTTRWLSRRSPLPPERGCRDAARRGQRRGQADWMFAPPVEQQLALLTRHPGRLHSDAAPWTDYMFLNTRVPPFDDVRVRQALNYAVDREKVVEFMGGLVAARSTCQILPRLCRVSNRTAPTRAVESGRHLGGSGHGQGKIARRRIRHERHPDRGSRRRGLWST